MAVERIEDYDDTLKVILKPTDKFPNGGYFYCDSDAKTRDLVNSHSWFLHRQGKRTCVEAMSRRSLLYFHREYAHSILDSYSDYIDHINGVPIDNTDNNLNSVTNQQNLYNKPTRGYITDKRSRYFQPQIMFNQELLQPYGVVHSEVEACILQRQLETYYLKSRMKEKYYMYNFLLDRRNDLDVLDAERTKQITSEEATYRHVLHYARDNAWYYFRYNLEQYFKDNNIPVPQYTLDEQEFMLHPITGKKLCPY